ncbi:MAG TPA: hypothetical protein ENJ18_11715 [Nannocystis exedens]|nr:hypothetical protein [Nannocystis exedens]
MYVALPAMFVLAACRPGLPPEPPGADAAQADATPGIEEPRVSPYNSSAFVDASAAPDASSKKDSKSSDGAMDMDMDMSMDHEMSPESRS